VRVLRRKLRPGGEEGFTLVELLIAMIVLTVGILALIAAYSSSYLTINRATRVSSTELLADQQMERFRALSYSTIALDLTCGPSCTQDSTYTGNSAYSSSTQVSGSSGTDSTNLSKQTKTGPDGRTYRLDTFVNYACAKSSQGSLTLSTSPLGCTYSSGTLNGTAGPSPVKMVTVVVTSVGGTGLGASGPVTTRETSSFTSITGN
jgi:prepilin-type N-terminal cleavage/methylation domain-containing protein